MENNLKNKKVKGDTNVEKKESKGGILKSVLFVLISYVIFFVINIPDDFENTFLLILGLGLIIVSTIVFIKRISKSAKESSLDTDINNKEKIAVNSKKEEIVNEFVGKSKEKILQEIYNKCEKFLDKYNHYFIFFGGWYDSYSRETDREKKEYFVDLSRSEFLMSLFIKILLNTSEKDKKKVTKFLKNLNSEYADEFCGLSNEELQKQIADSNPSDDDPGFDFDKWLKKSYNKLAAMKSYDWELNEEIWHDFILDIQNAYNAYVEPENSLNLLGQYEKTSAQNETDASNKAFVMLYLPVLLIIVMVIKFLIELFGESGIVMSGGWTSVIIFVVLIIWACIGGSGKSNTCSNCKKWNSLKLVDDRIIDSRDTWRTKNITQNGRTYQKQVAVRIDRHEEHYVCAHCGNKEIKYRDSEHQL